MSANTPASVVAAALAEKNGTPAPVVAQTGVTTPPAVVKATKAPKAPKASPPAAPKAKSGSTLITYEPGIVTLKLSDIDLSPDANTTRPEWADLKGNTKALIEDLQELADSIKAVGQQATIVVQRTAKGSKQPYRLAAGYRRCAAMALPGMPGTVECRIEATGTDEARIMVNITENENAKKETSALGKLKGVEALSALGHPVAEVARIAGHAEDFVRDLLRIGKASPELRTAITAPVGSDGHMGFGVGRQLLRFPVEQQPKLVKQCADLTVEATRAYLAEVRAAQKAEANGAEGEGAGTSSKKSDKKDSVIYPEARVVKATIPFIVKYGNAGAAMEAAIADLAKAVESTGMKIPPMVDAQKAVAAAHAAMVKAFNQQVTALSNLLDEKAYNAYVKAALADAKE